MVQRTRFYTMFDMLFVEWKEDRVQKISKELLESAIPGAVRLYYGGSILWFAGAWFVRLKESRLNNIDTYYRLLTDYKWILDLSS